MLFEQDFSSFFLQFLMIFFEMEHAERTAELDKIIKNCLNINFFSSLLAMTL